MTKKSLGRVMRDLQAAEKETANIKTNDAINDLLQNNTIYDDIRDLYTKCAITLESYSHGFVGLNLKELAPHWSPEQSARVATLNNTFGSDVDVLVTNLIDINAPYKDKTGGEKNIDAFIQATTVATDIGEFIGRATGTLDPVFRGLVTEATETRSRLGLLEPQMPTPEEVALTNAQNPDIITDVKVK